MKRFLILLIAVALAGLSYAQVLTCYDVQFTTSANGNSPYLNQVVTVEGIVVAEKFYTGTNTSNYGFVISDPEGGPWSGLLIFTNRYFPQIGDRVSVTGSIAEYYEFTEMTSVSAYSVISTGNTLPAPALITTGTLANAATAEQWESCFVKVEDVNITAAPNSHQEFYINDGTGAAQVDDQCFPRSGFFWPAGVAVGQSWARIQGVVDFSFDYYAINPRTLNDILQIDSVANAQIRIPNQTAELDANIAVPVMTSRLKLAWGLSGFEAKIKIDPAKLELLGLDITSTVITQMPADPTISADGTEITIVFASQEPIVSNADEAPLINLLFKTVSYGEAWIDVLSFKYDETPVASLTRGKISIPIRENIAWLNIGNQQNSRNIFDPTLNQKLIIEYGSKVGSTGVNARVYVRIYDGKGRLVATPVNKVISSALGFENFEFDGRDSMMNYLEPGLYYCHLEIVERETGRKYNTTQPIVVRANLK